MHSTLPPRPPFAVPPPASLRTAAPRPAAAPPRGDRAPEPACWRWLLLGLAGAWPLTLVLPRMFCWFLAALPHEMGHATLGCLLGRPSAPAISLAGHAWTGIAERRTWLVVAVALAFAATAWHQRRALPRCLAFAAAAALLPALAFGKGGDLAIAAGGHLGELAFATYCFHLCTTGGRTGTPQERVACALAGSLLQGMDLRLCFSLMTSAAARAEYAGNGSLGLKNDLLVLAEDLLHCRLQTVAAAMLVLALLPLPLGVAIGWWKNRAAGAAG